MSTTNDKPIDGGFMPERICAQIGQRKRYFDTREEAIAAIMEFTERQNKPKKK